MSLMGNIITAQHGKELRMKTNMVAATFLAIGATYIFNLSVRYFNHPQGFENNPVQLVRKK